MHRQYGRIQTNSIITSSLWRLVVCYTNVHVYIECRDAWVITHYFQLQEVITIQKFNCRKRLEGRDLLSIFISHQCRKGMSRCFRSSVKPVEICQGGLCQGLDLSKLMLNVSKQSKFDNMPTASWIRDDEKVDHRDLYISTSFATLPH